MAILPKTITDTWQAITAAGQSGSAWMVEFDDIDGKVGKGDVIIYHTDGDAPVNDEKIEESKRLYEPNDNTEMMILTADNMEDVFYARCKTTGSEAKINVDVN